MRRIVKCNPSLTFRATPIDAEAFAPFGDLVAQPPGAPRKYWSEALTNPRPNASLSLSTANVARLNLPATLTMMERHAYSFQTFIPLDASAYLLCVAPGGGDDLPEIDEMRVFVVPSGIGITYHANTWHHPMLALDRTAQFAILMWTSGGDNDEEFVDLSQPVYVQGTN